MHLCACFFYSGGLFNLKDKAGNWQTADGLDVWDEDGETRIYQASIVYKYISSFYFATVTCATVGYGDIKASNDFELFWVMLIMLFGVSIFSYVLGDMASQFGEITRSNKAMEERNRQIGDLDTQFNIGAELTQRLESYFKQNKSLVDDDAKADIEEIMNILPEGLKLQLSMFVNKEAIAKIPFLKNRES